MRIAFLSFKNCKVNDNTENETLCRLDVLYDVVLFIESFNCGISSAF